MLWKDALVVKLVRKHIIYMAITKKLKSLWKLQAGFDIMIVGNDNYKVKFVLQVDRDKIQAMVAMYGFVQFSLADDFASMD